MASATTSSAATTPLIMPNSSARAAGTGSPVMIISRAMARPMARGRRNKPPAAATRERFTSGRPNTVSCAATMRSQARAISQPPATAVPGMAAISGFSRSRLTIPAKPPRFVDRLAPFPAAISFRSAPAQKTEPVAVTTPTQSSGSFSSVSSASSIPRATSPLTAFRASGRLSVIRPTRPRRSNSTTIASLPWNSLSPSLDDQKARSKRGDPTPISVMRAGVYAREACECGAPVRVTVALSGYARDQGHAISSAPWLQSARAARFPDSGRPGPRFTHRGSMRATRHGFGAAPLLYWCHHQARAMIVRADAISRNGRWNQSPGMQRSSMQR